MQRWLGVRERISAKQGLFEVRARRLGVQPRPLAMLTSRFIPAHSSSSKELGYSFFSQVLSLG